MGVFSELYDIMLDEIFAKIDENKNKENFDIDGFISDLLLNLYTEGKIADYNYEFFSFDMSSRNTVLFITLLSKDRQDMVSDIYDFSV